MTARPSAVLRLLVALPSLMLVVPSVELSAQPSVGPEVRVDGESAEDLISASAPAISLDDQGRVLVAWQHTEQRVFEPDVVDVHRRFFDAADSGSAEGAAASSQFDETEPHLVSDGRGRNLLVFHRNDLDHPPGCTTVSFGEVRYQLYEGDALVSSGEVNSNAGGGRAPAAAMANDGTFAVAYEGNDCPGLGITAGTKLRRFPGPLSELDGLFSELPLAVAINSSRATGLAIAHPSAGLVCDTSAPCPFTVQRFAPNGDALPAILFDLYANTGLVTTFAPAVALQEDGGVVVVWVRLDFNEPQHLFVLARRFDADGDPAGPEVEVSAGVVPDGSQSFAPPALAMAEDGSFVVAFTVEGAAYARLFDASAMPLGPPVRLSDRVVDRVAAARSASGGVAVAYQSEDAIYYRRLFTGSCLPSETELCLNGGRFRVRTQWREPSGGEGVGRAQPLTVDTGYFWFFDAGNVEVVVKVLDACVPFDRFWVFAAGLTNVEVELVVEDVETGATRTYFNPLDQPFQPIQDTGAFTTCP